MMYAVEQINNSTVLLPGIKLGYDIRNSCDEPEVVVHHTLDNLLDRTLFKPNVQSSSINEFCIDPGNSTSVLAGVIGGFLTPISAIISTILSTDYIPQISYASTSAVFSDKRWHYRNFLRTVPSDKHQARAIVDLIAHFNWSYISAFAIDDEYGRVGLDELKKAAKKKGICLATAHFFDQDIVKETSKHKLDHIIDDLSAFGRKSHIVILWSPLLEAEHIIKEAVGRNLTHVTWVGTELWNERFETEFPSQNIIYPQLVQPTLDNYIDYMTSTFHVMWRNPWFRQLFSDFCPDELYYGSAGPPEGCLFPFRVSILPSVVNRDRRKYPQVIAAVYTFAYGLHQYLNCTSTKCTIPNTGIDYKGLLDILRVCDFVVPNTTNYRVNFNHTTGEIQQKQYEFFLRGAKGSMGIWNGPDNLTVNEMIWGDQGIPEGRCSSTCLPGSYRLNGSSPCCWVCLSCIGNTISTGENQYRCKKCRTDYEVANDNNTACIQLREIRIQISDYVGLLLLVSCVVGVLVVLFIILVFARYWDTPVVKSSSREISLIQLLSLMLLFCLPLMFYFPLSPVLCIVRTLVFGFLFTTVIAIILVKTYRLIRVFSDRFTKVSRFLHNRYQILFIYALVVFELIAIFFWNWNFMPEVLRDVRLSAKILYFTCDRNQNILFWIVLLYIFILTLFTGYLAFRARKLPEIYNDAQFISLAMFTACVVWVTYVPLYFSFTPYERNIAFLVLNFVCTLSLTVILFSYKVKVILFRPQINSPEYARQAQRQHFLESFHRDVSRHQTSPNNETPEPRPRLNSLPIAVHKPSVFDEPDGKLRSPNEPVKLTRRASYTSMSNLESIRRFKSYDTFATLHSFIEPPRTLKKSQSTPFLGDGSPPVNNARLEASTSQRAPNSHFGTIGRVLSNVSISKLLLHSGHEHESSRSLLSSSSDKLFDTKL